MIAFGDPLLSKFRFNATDSASVTSYISVATKALEAMTNRYLVQAKYDLVWPLLTTGEIHLPAYPVVSIDRIALNWQNIIQIKCTNTNPSVATSNTGLNLISASAGVYSTTTLTWASYPTLSQLVSQINSTSGWSASMSASYNNIPSSDVIPGQNLQQNGVPLSVWDYSSVSQYTCDFLKGIVNIGLPFNWYAYDEWDFNNRVNGGLVPPFFQNRVRAVWTGGYDDTAGPAWPNELNYVLAELVGFYFDSKTGQFASEQFETGYKYEFSNDLNRIPIKAKQIVMAYKDYYI